MFKRILLPIAALAMLSASPAGEELALGAEKAEAWRSSSSSGYRSSRTTSSFSTGRSSRSSSVWRSGSSTSKSGTSRTRRKSWKTKGDASGPKATGSRDAKRKSADGATKRDRTRKSVGSGDSGSGAKTTRTRTRIPESPARAMRMRDRRFDSARNAGVDPVDRSAYGGNALYESRAGRFGSYGAYYDSRRDFYRASDWSRPSYMYDGPASFGMWDAAFLWMTLDNIDNPAYAMMAFHHRRDPGMLMFLSMADGMANERPELKDKLDRLEREVARIEKKGVERDPDYLPEDVPASAAIAPEVAVDAPKLVMGTGGKGGNYYPFCAGDGPLKGLKALAAPVVEIECASTNGSVGNMEGLASGEYDAILVQTDVYDSWSRAHPDADVDGLKADAYAEYVQMVANEAADVSSVGDLDPDRHTLYLVGSGAEAAWEGFARHDEWYGQFAREEALVTVANEPGVLTKVAEDPDGVLMFISGLSSDLLRKANDMYGDALELVVVDDWDFNDAKDRFGDRIYTFQEIPGERYPNLMEGSWYSWGDTEDKESLAVTAMFLLSKDWANKHGREAVKAVEDALWQAIPRMRERVNPRD